MKNCSSLKLSKQGSGRQAKVMSTERGCCGMKITFLSRIQFAGTLLLSSLVAVNTLGQLSVTDPLPMSKSLDFHYQFPVSPGHPGLLAGTMGELRSTHLHAGIDIRTNKMVGGPILAAKEGYISPVWISTFGY